ncbi:MAG: ATP-dependent DNA helicase [Magnetococcales bacterium]|nr:ATP-dependent DNA helicase [Magnetococcales bacterium]
MPDAPDAPDPFADQSPESLVTSWFGPNSRLAGLWPGYEPRPAQELMAQRVVEAVRGDHFLLVEAGTGTGKTIAYLLPILSLGLKAVISTATKALQDQIWEKDLPLLRHVVDRPFTAARLKGRSNYLCRFRFRDAHAAQAMVPRKEQGWLRRLGEWALSTDSGDRDEVGDLPEELSFWPEINARSDNCTGQQCPDYGTCFLMKARQAARGADLVIVNHHLLFADLAVKEEGFGEILPQYRLAVFDEAHQLPDVATRYFGLEIGNFQVRRLVQDARRDFAEAGGDDPALMEAMERLETLAAALRVSFPDSDARGGLEPSDMFGEVGRTLAALENGLNLFKEAMEFHRGRSAALAARMRRAEELLTTAGRIRALDDPNRVFWYETRGRWLHLRASPLEMGEMLRQALYPRLNAAVFTSATLATGTGQGGFRYFADQMGLSPDPPGGAPPFPLAANDEPRTPLPWEGSDGGDEPPQPAGPPPVVSERLPPAFDHARQSLLYLPQGMPEPDKPDFPAALVGELLRLIEASRGRALCLFTSFRMLQAARSGLAGKIPYTLLTQGERPKAALLGAFREDPASVLLGTGSFWEGVDVPGEALSLVVVDRLPFPSPGDPLTAARGRYLEGIGRGSFRDYYLPRAILSLKQGLGRLLRRGDDRGVMAVLDVRLSRGSYRNFFFAGLPPVPVTRDLERVRQFFAEDETSGDGEWRE